MPIFSPKSLFGMEPTIWGLIVVGLLTLGSSVAIHLSWGRVVDEHLSLQEEVANVRHHLTTAHLWFEEALAGDARIKIGMVWERFDRAEAAIDRLLEGISRAALVDQREDSDTASLESSAATDLSSLVYRMHDLATARWQGAGSLGGGSVVDQRFHETFEQVLPASILVDDALKRHFGMTARRQRGLLGATLAIWLIVLGGIVSILSMLVRMRRRAAHEKEVLKQQLWQAQKFDAIGQLAGGIAHDFNNLLVAIIGHNDLMSTKLREDHPAREDAEVIRRASQQAASLTQQLLAIARRQVLQPRVLDLNAVINELQPILRRLIKENIDVEIDLERELGAVRADSSQIGQVVLNLAVNGRDAMPRGGRLRIVTANARIDEANGRKRLGIEPGPYSLIAVSDTGCGLDETVQARLFDPFFTTKGPGKGTGLGLSTVHGIVVQSGGTIDVESEPGEGTTFRVYLPRVDEPPEDPEVPCEHASTRGGGRETVLLVEDQDPVRRLVRKVLQSSGYELLEASDGESALEVASSFDGVIHLLLSDVVLPGMAGTCLAKELLARRPATRILYISGHAHDAREHPALADPQCRFLQKPFTPDELIRTVRELLDAVHPEPAVD